MPEVEINVGHRLAGVDVDNLDIKVDWNTLLALGDILADELAVNDCKNGLSL